MTTRSKSSNPVIAGRTRTQIARTIAICVIVFTRKARKRGCVNTITRLAIYEAAAALDIPDDEFSIRTVIRMVREDCRLMGETHLLGEDIRP